MPLISSIHEKKIIIIAGPNGAGKTTFAEEFLPREAGCPIFVNADLIAAGLAPFEPERAAFHAGRLMLEEIFNHVRRGESFAFETTLSGRNYAGLIPSWRTDGYIVKLFFLRLSSPELAIAREATTFLNLSSAGVLQQVYAISRDSTNRRLMSGRFTTIPAATPFSSKKE